MVRPAPRQTRDRELRVFCDSIIEGRNVDAIRRKTLAFLGRSLGVSKANFFLTESQTKHISFTRVISLGIRPDYQSRYREHYFRFDPFYRYFAQSEPHRLEKVQTTSDVIPYRNMIRTEYYNEFLKPQAIYHQMVLYLNAANRLLGTIALFRSKGAGGFSDRDRDTALSVAPYLAVSLEKALALEKNHELRTVVGSLLPQLPFQGLMILDRFLEPIYWDENAASLLADQGGPSADLPREIYRQCQELLGVSQHAPDQADQARRIRLAGARQSSPVFAQVCLVREPGRDPLFMIYVQPEAQMPAARARLREFGLTKRQIEVVDLLGLGLRNREIAQRLFISEYTVENHLRAIYRKVGVANRTAVTHKLFNPSPE